MLFLLNDRIVEIEAPEIHLARRWRALGCGEPSLLLASDALDFVQRVVSQCRRDGEDLDDSLICDLAALIVAKTGANAALVPTERTGNAEMRLTRLPDTILAALLSRATSAGELTIGDVWSDAA